MFRKTVPSVDSPHSPSNAHLSSTHHMAGLVFQIGPFPVSVYIHFESWRWGSSFVCVLIKHKSNVYWLSSFYITNSHVFGRNVAFLDNSGGVLSSLRCRKFLQTDPGEKTREWASSRLLITGGHACRGNNDDHLWGHDFAKRLVCRPGINKEINK